MKFKILFWIGLITLTVGCGSQPKQANGDYITISGRTQGTTYKVVYRDSLMRDLSVEINKFLDSFDATMSIYNSESALSRINRGDDVVELNSWFIECFELSQKISVKTDGMLDATLSPLIAAYGFGPKREHKVLNRREIDSMLNFVGYEKVTISEGRLIKRDGRIKLDFNAIAKGFSVDLIGRMMDSMGIENYLVEIGGEIFCRGVNSKGMEWAVAIDAPVDGNYVPGIETQAVIRFSGMGLATSGNYRNFAITDSGARVTHIVDPRTGWPVVHNLLSVTIIAPTCGEADGFATACMVAGLEEAVKIVERNPEIAALFVYSEGSEMKIRMTDNMKLYVVEN